MGHWKRILSYFRVGFQLVHNCGFFIFLTLKYILASVTGTVNTIESMIKQLDNRVQTMNNDLVKVDALMSHALDVRPNIDRLAANEGKEDARKD